MPSKTLSSAVYNALLKRGRRIVPTTDPETLRKFFRMLQPVNGGKELVRLGAATPALDEQR